MICIYQRRWSVELLIWERKSGLGLGQHQVNRNEDWIEKSFGMAIPAYLFLLGASSSEILPGCCWSIFQRQHNLRLQVIIQQVGHNMELRIQKRRKSA